MEFAVHRAVAESAHANAGGSGDRKNPRHAARRRYQSAAEPSVFALCIGCLDEQTTFDSVLVPRGRWWSGTLRHGAAGSVHCEPTPTTSSSARVGTAPQQSEDCLLQACAPHKEIRAHCIWFSGIWVSTARRANQRQQNVCRFHTCGQKSRTEIDAGRNPTKEVL